MRGRFYVTEHDISGGHPCCPHRCPVANSIRRDFKRGKHDHRIGVGVASNGITLDVFKGGAWVTEVIRPLPPEVEKFVGDFDNLTRPVTRTEFSFEMEIPPFFAEFFCGEVVQEADNGRAEAGSG